MQNDNQLFNRDNLFREILFLKSIQQWKKETSVSFLRIFHDNYKKLFDGDKKAVLYKTLYTMSISISMQMACYMYEWIKNSGMDEGVTKSKNDFKNLKLKIDVDGIEKTTNAKQLLKIIRDAFAHNDDSEFVSNWSLDDDANICIQSKIGRTSKRHKIVMRCQDLLDFIYMTYENMIDMNKNSLIIDFDGVSLHKVWKKRELKSDDIKRYIKQYKDENDTLLEMDNYQINAILGCFEHGFFKDEKTNPCHMDFLVNVFPSIRETVGNFVNLQNLLSCLSILGKNYYNYETWFGEIVKSQKILNSPYKITHLMFMMSTGKIDALISINILFSLFSFASLDKIANIFNEDIEKMKKIRNSVMHGRYFYNHRGGFEFYDGVNNENLQHIATISVKKCAETAQLIIYEENERLKTPSTS